MTPTPPPDEERIPDLAVSPDEQEAIARWLSEGGGRGPGD